MGDMDVEDRIQAYLWGAAIGDAVGARLKAGRAANKTPELRISALTQLLLFGAEALIRSFHRANTKGIWPDFVGVTDHALARWLATQELASPRWGHHSPFPDGWLISCGELWRRADPNAATTNALRAERAGSPRVPVNTRRGSSSLCLAALIGLAPRPVDDDHCRDVARGVMALTHGHHESLAVAAAAAVMVRALVHGGVEWSSARRRAHAVATGHLRSAPQVGHPLGLLADDKPGTSPGDGTTAASALAIALQAAGRGATFQAVLANATQHGGAIRTTCQLAGALSGARHGLAFIPAGLRASLVERWTVSGMADDLGRWMSDSERQPGGGYIDYRYPPH